MHDIKDDVFKFSQTKNSIYFIYEKKTCVNDMAKKKIPKLKWCQKYYCMNFKGETFLLTTFCYFAHRN